MRRKCIHAWSDRVSHVRENVCSSNDTYQSKHVYIYSYIIIYIYIYSTVCIYNVVQGNMCREDVSQYEFRQELERFHTTDRKNVPTQKRLVILACRIKLAQELTTKRIAEYNFCSSHNLAWSIYVISVFSCALFPGARPASMFTYNTCAWHDYPLSQHRSQTPGAAPRVKVNVCGTRTRACTGCETGPHEPTKQEHIGSHATGGIQTMQANASLVLPRTNANIWYVFNANGSLEKTNVSLCSLGPEMGSGRTKHRGQQGKV